MKRIVWMGIGVAIGVIAFRKITEAQANLGPEGLNRAVGRMADGMFDFADAVAYRDAPTRGTICGQRWAIDDAGASPALAGAVRPRALNRAEWKAAERHQPVPRTSCAVN